ncbi:conserved hypothetical protein [Trichormus variabilis ATCC 29413]|uniref:Uncharacterized protein n=3 Tax=Anabaena variabilis TaxID=264691 RepID=Q3M4W4_TRIV2|nr:MULTISPECIES: hypothetical protein [Nostocaceae]ABA23972.1 conserved hypothetical protein [Trichormus variabilis ATCC 29413]MBC1214875.1 hypothetical protein [Trichormus variabilis ARAD]MBC1258647.1 hypothetical protein [Trichormus variabilis V5]MBC1268798.1 hypothetical protein [Trichormus variabilis FSR]MBC1303127.1 hypothetical protein [Trichormus variabilis N2B]
MAFIAVKELQVTGAELFQDSESFLNELNNLDNSVHGGGDYSNTTNGVLDLAAKGFEFGVITYGIDAIGHLAKSYSDAGYY